MPSKEIIKRKERKCIACDFGLFIGDVPVSGECRRSPPRSFLESKGGNPGRFFVPVRFNDWCGLFRFNKDDELVNDNLRKISAFGTQNERLEIADRLKKSGDFEGAMALYVGVFEADPTYSELAFKIAQIYFEKSSKDKKDLFAQKAFEWYEKAAELNHAESLFYVGLNYVQGCFVECNIKKANEHLKESAKHGCQRAKKKIDEGGFELREHTDDD